MAAGSQESRSCSVVGFGNDSEDEGWGPVEAETAQAAATVRGGSPSVSEAMEMSGDGDESNGAQSDLHDELDRRDQPFLRGPARWGPRALKDNKQTRCTICYEKNAAEVLERINYGLALAVASIGGDFYACCEHAIREYNAHVDDLYRRNPVESKERGRRHLEFDEFSFHAHMCPKEIIVTLAIHEQHLLGVIRTLGETTACYKQRDGTTILDRNTLQQIEKAQRDLTKTQKEKEIAKRDVLERQQKQQARGVRFARN